MLRGTAFIVNSPGMPHADAPAFRMSFASPRATGIDWTRRWVAVKRLLIGLLLACANTAVAFAQGPPDVNVFSFADTSCAEWALSKNNELSRAIYEAWFRGFVSGYNFGNSANQVALDKMPDRVALALYIDKYCRDNPKLPFIGAAIPLVQEIREVRSVVPARRP